MTARRRELTDEARAAGRRWGWALGGGLIITAVFNFAVYALAVRTTFPLEREDYYDAATAYDSVVAAGDRLRADGLSLKVDGDGRVRLLGRDGAVVVTAATLAYYRPDDPHADYRTAARAAGDGLRPATAPQRPGRWDVTLSGWASGRRVAATARWYLTP